jgi:hypothetical protein
LSRNKKKMKLKITEKNDKSRMASPRNGRNSARGLSPDL